MSKVSGIADLGQFEYWRLQFFLLLIAIILSVFSSAIAYTGGQGLKVILSSFGLADKNGDPAVKVVSYSVTLQNSGTYPVAVDNLVPIYSTEIYRRTILDEPLIVVEKVIYPGETLGVNGELQFVFQGVSKNQILNWNQMISGYKVTTEQILPNQH